MDKLGRNGHYGYMNLLRFTDLRNRILGLPHEIRESWPLNRIPRSRDWELLVISYLVLVALLLTTFFAFFSRSIAP